MDGSTTLERREEGQWDLQSLKMDCHASLVLALLHRAPMGAELRGLLEPGSSSNIDSFHGKTTGPLNEGARCVDQMAFVGSLWTVGPHWPIARKEKWYEQTEEYAGAYGRKSIHTIVHDSSTMGNTRGWTNGWKGWWYLSSTLSLSSLDGTTETCEASVSFPRLERIHSVWEHPCMTSSFGRDQFVRHNDPFRPLFTS